jgi:hypothetical protein
MAPHALEDRVDAAAGIGSAGRGEVRPSPGRGPRHQPDVAPSGYGLSLVLVAEERRGDPVLREHGLVTVAQVLARDAAEVVDRRRFGLERRGA